jgi:hypothetical protein
MQDMSPDMENLMRKASEAYPLKQLDDRWDEIASNINVSAPEHKGKKTFGLGKYFASVLLLFLFLFLGFFFFNKPAPRKFSKPGVVQPSLTTSYIKQAPDNNVENAKPLSTSKSKVAFEQEPGDKMPQSESSKHKPGNKQRAVGSSYLNRAMVTSNEAIDSVSRFALASSAPGTIRQSRRVNRLELPQNDPQFLLHPKSFSFDESVFATKKKGKENYRKGFYYGIVAGSGFNITKNKEVKKASWNIGLLGGYHFTKKLSVETGFLFSQKNYTTIGDHFSMKEIGSAMPPAMKVKAVDGYSKVIEVPIVINHEFIRNSKGHFFSTAGISSYLLTNENNHYHTSTNGVEEMMYGTYKTNRRYLAASIDLGVGYSKNFGNKNSIRFQPYLQVPLRGVGVGNLQITGAGLRIALTNSAY